MGLFEKKYHGWSWFTPLKCSYVGWSLNCKLLDYWLRIFLKYRFITFYLKVGTPIHPMDDGIIVQQHGIILLHPMISVSQYLQVHILKCFACFAFFPMYHIIYIVYIYIHMYVYTYIYIYIVLYNYISHFSFIYYLPPDWRNTVSIYWMVHQKSTGLRTSCHCSPRWFGDSCRRPPSSRRRGF